MRKKQLKKRNEMTVTRRKIEEEYPDTPDELFKKKVDDNYKKAEEELLVFVEQQISLMKENLLFNGEDIPSFYSLNKSLMDYESVLLGLLAIHQEVRMQKALMEEKYDNFYAEKYCEVKSEQANLGKQAQFTAAREIDMLVRKRWILELSTLKAESIKIDNQYNFINYLIDGWKNYAFILNTLSKNAQAEASASGISSRNPKEFGDEM